MALFKSFVLGEVRKSVANITMYAGANGYSIARGKRSTMRNSRTPGQLTQRAKMKALQVASLYFAPAAELGFPGRKAGSTFYNAFVKANMKAVTVDEEYNPTIDYEKIVCAEGSLQDGTLAVSLNEDQDMITITQEAQSRWSVVANPTDVLYVVVYEKTGNQMIVEPCRNRQENGVTTIGLDDGWVKENLEVYAFMLSKDKRKASNSKRLMVEMGKL